ncbi:MAG: hypothetical protein WDN69_06830 [Aliidongia sp.]
MHPGTRARSAALLGVPIGMIAAASVYLPIGNFRGSEFSASVLDCSPRAPAAGWCWAPISDRASSFGSAYGVALRRAFPGNWAAVAGFILASLIGERTCGRRDHSTGFQWVQPLLGDAELPSEALAGLIGGAVGGGFLGRIAALLLPGLRWHRLMATGAALGLLLPIALDEHRAPLGVYLFYMIWQGGYGVALATARRATPAWNRLYWPSTEKP